LTGKKDRILITTGIYLYKNQFSDKNGFTCRNHTNALIVTGKVRNLFKKIEAFVFSDKCKTLKDVHNWNKEDVNTFSFVDFIRTELLKKDIELSTAAHHKVLIRQIESFGKIRTFQDLTYENIYDFDVFLRKTIRASSTLNKRHTNLKHYVQLAINRGLITVNPYANFKMPLKKGKDPTFLFEDEIKKIIDWIPVNDRLAYVKDLFLFQIFTGMAYADMVSFDKSYISELDGYRVIRSNRQKTDENFISLFLPDAERIADKYGYSLPKISNQKYNDYLKLLASGVGIDKNRSGFKQNISRRHSRAQCGGKRNGVISRICFVNSGNGCALCARSDKHPHVCKRTFLYFQRGCACPCIFRYFHVLCNLRLAGGKINR
jgi:site-specific recombinase XerD